MTLTLEVAAKATGATVRNAPAFPRELRVVTDTRLVRDGDTFLALHGERFDGHDFLRQALERGAGALIVEHADDLDAPALLVPDTRRAYMNLAGAARAQYGGIVIAITGSTGKTTTKHLLAQLLGARFGANRVLATPANENNEIGVSHLLLRACETHDALVVEMGARHAGEIAELVAIARPHAGLLTNIGEAHLEVFGSRQALADTKWGLFSDGAQAILNAHDATSQERAAALSTPPRWFGVGEPLRPGTWVVEGSTLCVNDARETARLPLQNHLPGAHNRANLAAAIAAARFAALSAQEIARAVPDLELPSGRYESVALPGGWRVIYDAYNASESGTLATLGAFAQEPGTRRIAVLASMAELGSRAERMHERVGERAAQCAGVLLFGGDYADALVKGALRGGADAANVAHFHDNAAATAWLRRNARAGDVVLLKGSRKYKMEEILAELRS